MKRHFYTISALSILLTLAGGCGGQTDLTQTLRVQQSGLLGRWYEVRSDSDMVKRYGRLVIVAPDDSAWQGVPRAGKVSAGTKIVSCRVVRATDLVAFMVLPVYYTREKILGMIVDGPHAGKEVDLSGPFGAKLDAVAPATQPFIFSDRRDNPPMQWTEPAAKVLVARELARRRLGH